MAAHASGTEGNDEACGLNAFGAGEGFEAAAKEDPETRGDEAGPETAADGLGALGCGGRATMASLAAAMRCVAAAAIAAAVDADTGETGCAWHAFSVIILRRDAKLSIIPPSSLLLVSSRTPSKEDADAASDRRELDAAVILGSS